MTVAELITALQQMPQDAPVVLMDREDGPILADLPRLQPDMSVEVYLSHRRTYQRMDAVLIEGA